ncbi:hypothetical protein [Williamsia sterculiae]|nr:hypothetical protein [Williamsia sterculiae]
MTLPQMLAAIAELESANAKADAEVLSNAQLTVAVATTSFMAKIRNLVGGADDLLGEAANAMQASAEQLYDHAAANSNNINQVVHQLTAAADVLADSQSAGSSIGSSNAFSQNYTPAQMLAARRQAAALLTGVYSVPMNSANSAIPDVTPLQLPAFGSGGSEGFASGGSGSGTSTGDGPASSTVKSTQGGMADVDSANSGGSDSGPSGPNTQTSTDATTGQSPAAAASDAGNGSASDAGGPSGGGGGGGDGLSPGGLGSPVMTSADEGLTNLPGAGVNGAGGEGADGLGGAPLGGFAGGLGAGAAAGAGGGAAGEANALAKRLSLPNSSLGTSSGQPTGAAGAPATGRGTSGSMPPGAGGRKGKDGEGRHRAAAYMHNTENGAEIIGGLPLVAPPVLGDWAARGDGPDGALPSEETEEKDDNKGTA